MATSTVTTKFSVDDICYVAIHPTADILQCQVMYIRITPTTDSYTVTYRVKRTDVIQVVDYINESELYTFAEAKTELLTWLNGQVSKITTMVEPPDPVV